MLVEARHLVQLGVKELTLIAQDTTKYGLDNYGSLKLADLIRKVDQIEGLHWVRILYMYPDEIDDELLTAMKESSKVLPYFDIPMQHANARMLRAMNRRSTKEEVQKLVSKIRNMFEEPTLRTTMIVGFPSETEEEFEELVDFIQEIQWDRMGAFTYSKEEDTSEKETQSKDSSTETKTENKKESTKKTETEKSDNNSNKNSNQNNNNNNNMENK